MPPLRTIAAMPDQPMQQYRGAVILCDHLDQMLNGKWAIVGTFTSILVRTPVHRFSQGLALYLRFQVEQTGRHPVAIRLLSRDAPTAPPILQTAFEAEVADVNSPTEIGARLPPFSVRCPVDPATVKAGQQVAVGFAIWVDVGGCALASTPLTVVFGGPLEPPRSEIQV